MTDSSMLPSSIVIEPLIAGHIVDNTAGDVNTSVQGFNAGRSAIRCPAVQW